MTLEEVADNHGLTPEGVDYALRQYQIVISEITHGLLSKLSYDAHDVLQCAQERWCDTCELKAQEIPDTNIGRWLHLDPREDATISGKCSCCGWEAHYYEDDVADMPYCPNCGAKMDLEEQNER